MAIERTTKEHKLVSLDKPKYGVTKGHFFWSTDTKSNQRMWREVTQQECQDLATSQPIDNLKTILSTFAQQAGQQNRELLFYSPPNTPNSFAYLLATKNNDPSKVTYDVAVVDASVQMQLNFIRCTLAVFTVVAAGIFLNIILAAALATTFLAIGAYEKWTSSSNMAQVQTNIKEELEQLDEGAKISITL